MEELVVSRRQNVAFSTIERKLYVELDPSFRGLLPLPLVGHLVRPLFIAVSPVPQHLFVERTLRPGELRMF